MEKVIEIKELTKVYKNARGITDLSLDVERGEIFGFLGPNGSGKTTTMRVMTGLMKPNTGSVKLFGYDINNDFEKAMVKVGAIVESPEHYLYMTAFDNIRQAARYYPDINKSRIDEVLELCGLIQFKKEKVKGFSLGMRQRLGIAIAIVHKPELLILDEPLNGLDVEGMIYIRKMLKNMAEQDKVTVFLSSHLIHDVELTCTRVGIVLQSKLRAVESMNDILNNYDSLENYFVNEVEKNAAI